MTEAYQKADNLLTVYLSAETMAERFEALCELCLAISIRPETTEERIESIVDASDTEQQCVTSMGALYRQLLNNGGALP